MAKADFYTVSESFIGLLNGAEVEYHKGEVVAADDPAIKKMPLHFEQFVVRGHEDHRRSAVEQATAAPGEKRRLRRKPKAMAESAPEPEPAPAPEPEPEPEPVPQGKALTLAGMKGH
jgi:hypothetical protein